jgi:SEC-C motif domain protein
MPQDDSLCPCRPSCSGEPNYTHCCGRFHSGPLHLQAPTAEALMRSRYSAFVLNYLPYLLVTWHPSTRPATLDPNSSCLRWLGLEIKHHTVLGEHTAQVEFVAKHKQGGRAQRFHEISHFVREGGQWFYVDGVLK